MFPSTYPTAGWKTVMPESLRRWKSDRWKLAGRVRQVSSFLKSSVSRPSMSITVDSRTRSTVRVEYWSKVPANKENRPRLSKGAASTPAPAYRNDLRGSTSYYREISGYHAVGLKLPFGVA